MDDRSFDRIARLFGAATDRRAGLRALLAGLAAGVVAGSAAAAARRGKDAAPEDAADDAEDGPDEERRKRRCKPAGKRCRKARRGCSKVCIKMKKGRRKRGACGCRAAGEPCTETVNCCVVDGSHQRVLAFAGSAPTAQSLAAEAAALCESATASARRLGLGPGLRELVLTLETHHLLLHPVAGHPGVMLHLVVDASATSAMLARLQVERVEP